MATRNTLEVLKQCFEEVVPRHDKRTTIAPLSFVVCLVYTYLGDSKTFSLEAIRRGRCTTSRRGLAAVPFGIAG